MVILEDIFEIILCVLKGSIFLLDPCFYVSARRNLAKERGLGKAEIASGRTLV